MSKTFRLFISSTFDDFRHEREVLQTKVFPHIKKYASETGYVFQPIDLRWGVNDEAQLDQKTLELCLSEVRACKTHLDPNFLIMVGNRYGWVPLPYAIKKEEFECLYKKVEDKDLLDEWYTLDENQLPPSFVIKERKSKEGKEAKKKEYDEWVKTEKKLRIILQNAVKLTNLSEEQTRKYFLSATEAEVEEGIIPYNRPTAFQTSTILSNNPERLELDPQHVFGFLREVKKDTQQGDMFIPSKDEQKRAESFKQGLQESLLEENILSIATNQIEEKKLDTIYLDEFEKRVVSFLEDQIDAQKAQELEQTDTPLKIEQLAQTRYALNKRKGFLQTQPLKKLLSDLDSYIGTKEQSEPFILYGASGRGKSALMAQAIEQTNNRLKEKVVYRFVGATPHSNSSTEILISIFDEICIDIRNEQQANDALFLDVNNNTESFEEFSYRVYDIILNIDEKIVIFIDAIDQLQNYDEFLWLPQNLPSNVKIIISSLDDENYQEDTRYFSTLQNKFTNLHEIPPFSEPKTLLKQQLQAHNRTLSEDQEKYFLEQYAGVDTPLYIIMATQEIKEWRSDDTTQTIAATQKGIIKEFISNLSGVHYHHKKFVRKVLGYIYASRDGISESELLQLLATDEAFIEEMAPETFHENPNHELPLVHWSRLHTALKPFLSIKAQDGEELIYFFHREFEDAVKNQDGQRKEHEAIIKATQQKILQNQDKKFDKNRWGILYITLITEYELRYRDNDKQLSYSSFISSLSRKSTLKSILHHLLERGINYDISQKIDKAIAYKECFYLVCYLLAENAIKEWYDYYARSLELLAFSYEKNGEIDKAVQYGEECLKIREDVIELLENNEYNQYCLTIAINNLAVYYENNSKEKDEISAMYQKSMKISEGLYKLNPDKYFDIYSTASNGVIVFSIDENSEYLIKSVKKNLQISKQHGTHTKAYITALNTYSDILYKFGETLESIKVLKEQLEIIKANFDKKPIEWMEYYITSLNNLATRYCKIESVDCIVIFKNSLNVIENYMYLADDFDNLYKKLFNEIMRISHFSQSTSLYIYIKDFEVLLGFLVLLLEKLNNRNSIIWNDFYTASANQLKAT